MTNTIFKRSGESVFYTSYSSQLTVVNLCVFFICLLYRVKRNICNDVENTVHEIHLEHYCRSLNNNNNNTGGVNKCDIDYSETERMATYDSQGGGGRANEHQSESASSSLQSCYSNVAEMRRMNLEANMFLQRMKSVSLHLKAEYDALEHSLLLGGGQNLNRTTSHIQSYIGDEDDII
jgi:hypothetical protein